VGDRQQGERRRQEERLRPRQEDNAVCFAQGWTQGRRGVGAAACGGPIGFGQEGGANPQGPRIAPGLKLRPERIGRIGRF
jgi:hypothetical protein